MASCTDPTLVWRVDGARPALFGTIVQLFPPRTAEIPASRRVSSEDQPTTPTHPPRSTPPHLTSPRVTPPGLSCQAAPVAPRLPRRTAVPSQASRIQVQRVLPCARLSVALSRCDAATHARPTPVSTRGSTPFGRYEEDRGRTGVYRTGTVVPSATTSHPVNPRLRSGRCAHVLALSPAAACGSQLLRVTGFGTARCAGGAMGSSEWTLAPGARRF